MSDETIARLHDDGLPPHLAARLDARLDGLATSFEPPEQAFEAIEARLDPPPRTPAWIGFAMAASLAALAVVLAFRGAEPDLPADPLAVEVDPAARANPLTDSDGTVLAARDRYRTASLPPALGGRAALGAGFLQVREDVSTNFADRLDELDPATREVVETNLQVIHGALTRIENALASSPDNSVLQELLMSTYRQELDYMGRVSQMPTPREDGSMEL